MDLVTGVIIGFLIIVVLVLGFACFMMYVAVEWRDNVILELRNEKLRHENIHDHLLTQLGEHGFEIRKHFSDSCEIEMRKKHE